MKKIEHSDGTFGFLTELRKGTYRQVWNEDRTKYVFVKNKKRPENNRDAMKIDVDIAVVNKTNVSTYEEAIAILNKTK